MDDILLGIALVGVFASIVAGIVANIVAAPLRRRMEALERRLDIPTNDVRAAEPRVEPAPEATSHAAAELVAPVPPAITPEESADTERAAEPAPTTSGAFNWEESFGTHWLIWIGGLALALGGAFLVKYTIDRDMLSPAVRIALGVVMGLALIGGGERLRRTPFERALAAVTPSYAPQALVAGGVATLFASIYAAYGFYDMMPALIAFVLLAAVAALAIFLSLLHGPFMALLGIAGGFVTPFLVSTGGHAAEALFPYLAVLIAGNLVVVRYKGWWWLAWITLAGAAIWPLIWFPSAWEAVDVYIIGPYLLITGALFVLVRHIWGAPASDVEGVPWPWRLRPAERVAWSALAVAAALLFVLVCMDQYGTPSTVMMAAAGVGTLLVARREPVFEGNAIAMAAVTALTVAYWQLPRIIDQHVTLYDSFGQALGTVPAMPPEVNAFLVTAAVFAALFGLGGFLALWAARRPALHAVLSTATPLVLFTTAYWRIKGFQLDLAWTVAALVIAVLLAGAARQTLRHLAVPGMTGAVGSYAVGVVAALALAVTTALENAWLTVALAALLPAIAWIEGKLELPALRHTALVLAAVVLVRLVLNPTILDYPLGTMPGLSWLLYGYGLPAVAFYAAARIFRKREDGITVVVLEAGALAFLVLLATFEARDLTTGGSPFEWPYTFADRAIHAMTWLAIAYGLYHTHGPDGRAVAVWGWRILGGMATVLVAAWQILFDSPLASNDPVGDWPVLNLMALAYGGPFVFSVLFRGRSRRFGDFSVMQIAGAMLLVTSLFWLTLEVRHAFHGSRLAHGIASDAEWYTYSLAWLCYAGVLLAVGIWRGVDVLRHASLGIFMLTVAKVFLFDMANLTGIYRALSFVGLGLALVAVGYFYRRFVFPPHAPESEDPLPSSPEEGVRD